MSPARRASLLPLVIAALAFATSAPLARLARPAHPLSIAAGRVLLAALVLAAFDLPGLVRSARALSSKARRRIGLAGVLLAGHFGLFQWGLDTTSLPAAVSLVSLEPLSVVLVAWWLFGERPSTRERYGVLIATLGAVVVAQGADQGEHRLLGDGLVIGAVVLFGFYVAIARAVRDEVLTRHYAPMVYGVAAMCLLFVLPFVPSTPGAQVWPLPQHALVMIALVGLIPTVVGHTLLQVSSRTLPPALVALVPPGETLGSILLAAVLIGGLPSGIEALGALVILVGALVALSAGQESARDEG